MSSYRLDGLEFEF